MGFSGKKGFVVERKSRPRIRRQRKPAMSAKQRTCFLETLAETCNVVLSAATAGFRPQRAYELKARDATFRRSWDVAIAVAYSQLELMMLERVVHGVERIVRMPGGESTVMREYNDRTGLALLKMHREGASIADEVADADEQDEALERIMARLDRLRERDGLETKGAAGGRDGTRDALALIEWGLAAAKAAR